MPKYLLLFFALALLIGSCTPVAASPTPPLAATVSPTLPPSPAPSATSTSLPQTKEHLIVTRDLEHWAVLNADGSLQKYMQIPGNGGFASLAFPSDVSPDGNWLAYQSGTSETEPYDLSLHLLNLDDGTSQFVTNLLSPDFPENTEPMVEGTFDYDPSMYGDDCADIACRRSLVREEVGYSAGLSSWSPDGTLLAFTAQIDGPSTDIYIYNLQEKTIRRLTDDLQNVDDMDWSPNGEWLLYANSIPGKSWNGRTFYVTDLQGETLEFPQEMLTQTQQWYMHGWISDNLYLLQAIYPEPGESHFRQLVVFDARNGKLTEIWPYSAHGVFIDASNQRVVLSSFQPASGDPVPNAPEQGTYFVSPNGEREKISDQPFFFLSSSPQIIGTDGGMAYHILSDGSINRIGATAGGSDNSSSPDKKWFFIGQADHEGRYRYSLYDDTYQRIRSWTLDKGADTISWRPDSLGIFLFSRENIYYLAIPDGEPQLLQVEVPPCPFKDYDPVICTLAKYAWRP